MMAKGMTVKLLVCKECGKTSDEERFYSCTKTRCARCENNRRKIKYHSDSEYRIKRLKSNLSSRIRNGRYLITRKAYDKKYNQKNYEKVRQSQKKWEITNPEKRRMKVRRRRERERQLAGSCSAEQWSHRVNYHENRCYYCKSSSKLTMDHRIPISRKGYGWPSNLVPACLSCNSQKRDMTEKEYRQWLNENNR